MFTAALFTTAKTWKQPKGSLTKEWIKQIWQIYTVVYNGILFIHKKEGNNAICSNMDEPRNYTNYTIQYIIYTKLY